MITRPENGSSSVLHLIEALAQPILVRGAKQLLTLRGPIGVRRGSALRDLALIEDGSVLIRDGIIAAVGTSRRVENLKEARSALEIPANGNVVMPGFVDASLNLGFDDISYVSHPSKKRKNANEFYNETVSLLRSCLQHGTLTAEVKANIDGTDLRSHFALFRQLARMGNKPVRVVRTCCISRSPDPDNRASKRFSDELTALALREQVQYLELKAESESTAASLALLLTAAEHAKLGFKLLWPGGPSNRLADFLSRFNPLTVCCPGHLSSEQCLLLSSAPIIIVFSPSREIFETLDPKCARDAVDFGGAIALSTGYDIRYAPTFNMQMALALAVMRLRLTPEEAITAATINAAYATGHGDSVGSLEVGKHADLVVLDVPDYREIHRQFGINHVELAIREGTVVFSRAPVKMAR
jgi:imidazolonepropionase